jgi:preprotein translocase subunit YajC
MPRSIVFIVIAVVIIGGLYFLSTLPKQQPTHTIEVAVPQGAPAGGNAH